MDANKRNHLFDEPRHNLERLVRQFGGEEAAARAIVETVDAALKSAELVIDDRGLYEQVFDIGGHLVTVSGRVVSGIVHIGTAWVPA